MATSLCYHSKAATSRMTPLLLVQHVNYLHYQSSSQTLYDILGVSRNATKEEIKTAFFKLSKQLHPDVQSHSRVHGKTFVEINEAYSTLVDPVKRTQYELELRTMQEYAHAPRYHAHRQKYSKSGYRYSKYESDYGFAQTHYQKQSKRKNAKVVLFLLSIVFIGSVVESLRIHSAYSHYQHKTDQETLKNSRYYAQVRERARNSSVSEQLAALRRHAKTMEIFDKKK